MNYEKQLKKLRKKVEELETKVEQLEKQKGKDESRLQQAVTWTVLILEVIGAAITLIVAILGS